MARSSSSLPSLAAPMPVKAPAARTHASKPPASLQASAPPARGCRRGLAVSLQCHDGAGLGLHGDVRACSGMTTSMATPRSIYSRPALTENEGDWTKVNRCDSLNWYQAIIAQLSCRRSGFTIWPARPIGSDDKNKDATPVK
ncbi:hypothetical protein SEVIR_9G102950v4 [Setaria viridis]|uniref:Uncharacterized protein n=1 Tax=Setaria viridis TaxID=4556 RepID=A0A4V6D0N6_SETVI|nr:uncharacterized protein LOC117840034 [Setaria viridis]TKV91535.1 hypothetical protein SEVIR_9G102950v2 [Setaria viridis]